MSGGVRGVMLGLGVAFVVIFTGMTFSAIESAELNFASIMAFGFSFLILGIVVVGLVGAIRNPPDEDE